MKQPTTPLLALAMLLLAHAPAIGQTTLSLSGGANIASGFGRRIGSCSGPDLGHSNLLGLAADFAFSDRLGIQLGGRYAQKGVGIEFNEEGVNAKSRIELDYLEFTALGRLRFPLAGDRLSLHLLTGPAVAVETGCGLSATNNFGDSRLEFEEECDEVNLERSAIDVGWAVGGGLDIGITEKLSASPGILYTRGLVDVDTASRASLQNRALTLRIGLAYAIR